MKTSTQDYQQPKHTGGEQKVILNEKETAETDELDPKFNQSPQNNESIQEEKPEPGDDAKTELI